MTSKFEIKEVALGQANYPPLLALSITNPPKKLYYIGNLPDNISIACIGIRKPTEFGVYACKKITEMFVNNGFTIISGMALGIDTVAHQSAIKAGG
jgi:DNA processing protein